VGGVSHCLPLCMSIWAKTIIIVITAINLHYFAIFNFQCFNDNIIELFDTYRHQANYKEIFTSSLIVAAVIGLLNCYLTSGTFYIST